MKVWVYILIPSGACVSVLGLPLEHVEFFEKKIRPVLAESCYECHNSVNKKKAGLALDYRDALLAGSENGDVIVPGDPEDSEMIWRVTQEFEDDVMPPPKIHKPVTPEEVAVSILGEMIQFRRASLPPAKTMTLEDDGSKVLLQS